MSRRKFQDYLSESLANSPELRQAYEEAQAEDEHVTASDEQPPIAGAAAALHKTCSECGRPIEFSTDPAHYEDTWWLCDECLGKELGIL